MIRRVEETRIIPIVSLEDMAVEKSLKALTVREPRFYPINSKVYETLPKTVDKSVTDYLSRISRKAVPPQLYIPKEAEYQELVA